jgi:hypothetical protein
VRRKQEEGEEKRRERKEKKKGKKGEKKKGFFSKLRNFWKNKRYLAKLVKNYFC